MNQKKLNLVEKTQLALILSVVFVPALIALVGGVGVLVIRFICV